MDYYHFLWQCPYFRWDERQRIGCECGLLRFPSKRETVRFARGYCAHDPGYKRCTLAAERTRYYEEADEHGTGK